MNLDHVRPAALSPELRAKWRAALTAEADESALARLAARRWEEAVEAEDYAKAKEIAAETDTWFEEEAGQ